VTVAPRLWTRDFVLAFTANFLMAFSFYLFMPTLPMFLSGTLHASATEASAALSAYVVAAIAVRFLAGYLIDTLPRKGLYLATFAVFAALTAAYLLVESVLSLAVLRFAYGLAWGVITTSGNTLAIDIVPSPRRGEGIGYYGMSMNIAMALGPMTGLFLAASGPFSRVFAASILAAVLGLAIAFAIRVPPRPRQPHQVISLDRFLLLPAIPAGTGLLLVTLSYGVVLTYTAMLAKEHGIGGGGFFFVALAVGILLARLTTGRLLDRGHGVLLAVSGAALAAASLALVGLHPRPWTFFSTALAMGLGYGMNYPAVQNLIVDMAGHHQRGTANSTYYIAFDVGVGLGIFFAGPVASRVGLSGVFAASALTTVAGATVLGLVTRGHSAKI
jgi:MFS family permease